jgi:undecaprenyl-diphosphatase
MFKNHILKCILLIGCFPCFQHCAYSQNAEIRLLKKINPTVPDSKFWNTTTKSAKPVSIGLPLAMFATGLVIKDNQLQENGLEIIGTFAITTGATLALKNLINRPRPYERYAEIYPDHLEDGRSFPSGHTSVAFGTATSLSIQYKQWYVAVPAYTWATAVGYSRMYLGQHHPTDIIGAAITGAGSAWISHKVTRWLRKDKKV